MVSFGPILAKSYTSLYHGIRSNDLLKITKVEFPKKSSFEPNGQASLFTSQDLL